MGEGTGIYGAQTTIGSGAVCYLNGAEIVPSDDRADVRFLNYGTTHVTGNTTFWREKESHPVLSNHYHPEIPTLSFTDANAVLRGELSNSGVLRLVNSTVRVSRRFMNWAPHACVTADANSTIICGGFVNRIEDPNQFDLSQATLELSGRELSVRGINRGADMAGTERNFAIGELRISGPYVKLVDETPDAALYVRDFYVGEGTSLNLNGVPVFYWGTFTNLGSVGGGSITFIPEPAGVAFLALGAAVVLLRRRRRR